MAAIRILLGIWAVALALATVANLEVAVSMWRTSFAGFMLWFIWFAGLFLYETAVEKVTRHHEDGGSGSA